MLSNEVLSTQRLFTNQNQADNFSLFTVVSSNEKSFASNLWNFTSLLMTFFRLKDSFENSFSFLNLQTEQRTSKAKLCHTTTWWGWTINHCSSWHRRWSQLHSFWIQLTAYTRCRISIFATRTNQTSITRITKCASRKTRWWKMLKNRRETSSIKLFVNSSRCE